ncbi:PRTRC system protein E [Lamprocystis purpurea]|jgi:PRTRC genetic system protein E|uniref:PRTRC system protein E n=1 Tax=Lamprocystis purpurea TaxID=61598 RepID=UPI0003617A30|nr:PRTRC system protein E [Lamprocystis purpurea]
MGLIEQLAGVLGDGERLRFELARNGDGGLTVMVQPLLAKPLNDLAGDTAALRAALAMPLRITGTTADLDARLPALLVTYGERRHDVGGKVAALDALREAGKAGARLADQVEKDARGKAPSAGRNVALGETAAAPTPAASQATIPTDPHSLF